MFSSARIDEHGLWTTLRGKPGVSDVSFRTTVLALLVLVPTRFLLYCHVGIRAPIFVRLLQGRSSQI